MLNHGLTLIELANLPDFLAYAIGGIHVNVHTPLTGASPLSSVTSKPILRRRTERTSYINSTGKGGRPDRLPYVTRAAPTWP